MTKIDALRRFLLPCLFPATITTTPVAPTTTKKRLSTSFRDDLEDNPTTTTSTTNNNNQPNQESSPDSSITPTTTIAPPRPSKTMVLGTIFGNRRGHVWFCIQHDRLSTRPLLLLELSIPTSQLIHEMRSGLVRIALECDRTELSSCPLRSVPVWTMYCNAKKLGFANRRRASDHIRLMLKTMQSITVGAGVIPPGFGSSGSEEIMYMRANYEHMVGGADSESFHLINPDECPGQELSVFLLRGK
ncbi:DUF617 domain-containing protein [Cephalotus follicularis]|uniref:DUF617 domain-containing protein n=1 Tax=Cephalotus follicularis TaxID=3775 RepID=A0A1Q3BCA6_CEPFO|nr:DUF617 domain-containing protein [Cephalotus follicularis]